MSKLHESQLNTADTKDIFKKAAGLRNTPTGLGKVFKGLRKDKIELSDLQSAWKNHSPNPYPDDTADITAILKSQGFGDKEIKKVYSLVFGKQDDGEHNDPVASETIQKIANYAIKNGIQTELISFLEKEYGFKESVLYKEKIVVEDIRRVFTEIIAEERSDRIELLRQIDKETLGRTKK
jgi:hypothetical protein